MSKLDAANHRIDSKKHGNAHFEKGDALVENMKTSLGEMVSVLNNGLGYVGRTALGRIANDIAEHKADPKAFWAAKGNKILNGLKNAATVLGGLAAYPFVKAGEFIAKKYEQARDYLNGKRAEAGEFIAEKHADARLGLAAGQTSHVVKGIMKNLEGADLSSNAAIQAEQKAAITELFTGGVQAVTALAQYFSTEVKQGNMTAKDAAREIIGEYKDLRGDTKALLNFAKSRASIMDRQIDKGGDPEQLLAEFKDSVAKQWAELRRNNRAAPVVANDNGNPQAVVEAEAGNTVVPQ